MDSISQIALGAGDHHCQCIGVAQAPVQLRHGLEVHAINAGDQGWWQQGHAGHRENFDDLVLVDIDKTDGGIHQEVDLVEQEGSVRIE